MDELVQDLVSALDDSSIKKDIDDLEEMSATSTKFDRELYRKRRTRKRRTTSNSSHLVSSLMNNYVVVNQINNSPKDSSSLDEAVKDYFESFTANCSDESDEHLNSLKNKLKNAVLTTKLGDRSHHKRAFKQATPCCCESDSHTENGSVIPVLRRHRKKKLKRMTIDNNSLGLQRDSQGPTSGSCDEVHQRKQPIKNTRTSPDKTQNEKMTFKITKPKKENKITIICLLCHKKPCDRLQQFAVGGRNDVFLTEKSHENEKLNVNIDAIITCQCSCHSNQKDESSISSVSSNSDTDSANFTQDDVAGDGDDEMTDFYAESDGGPVWGVPHIYPSWLSWEQRLRSSKDGAIMLHKMEESDISGNPYIYDPKFKRFVTGTMQLTESSRRGYHARNNRLPGMAARSIRRGRRRTKVKKAKEKSKDSDFQSSLSKLSLSARSKRMRLDGYRETSNNNKQEMSSQKFNSTLPPHPFLFPHKEQESMPEKNNGRGSICDSDSGPGTSSTPSGTR